jgi:hypothetical protein
VRSKIEAHLREIRFVKRLLPITSLVLETGTFDPHALKSPEVLHNTGLYQRGINYGYANTRAYVLTRDSYSCQQCQGKARDRRLEVHHLVFRSEQGSDEESNLLTLCKSCHDGLHAGEMTLKHKGKQSSQQRMVTGKIGGFRTFDKVRYCGQDYFIKGRMSSGYAILMDVAGTRVALKPIPKFEKRNLLA